MQERASRATGPKAACRSAPRARPAPRRRAGARLARDRSKAGFHRGARNRIQGEAPAGTWPPNLLPCNIM
ncbi:hypothetical protein GCM10009552_39320 [Rothia nasimurium]